ncbi:MAG: hypothetical protein ABFS19_09110 [Thermodesulfobacteriota bacterium]
MKTSMILLSCLVWSSLTIDSAIASEKSVDTKAEPSAPATAARPEKKTSFDSVEERRIYQTLQQEKEGLRLEKKLLEEKEKELKTLEAEVDKKLEQVNLKIENVKKIKADIEALLTEKNIEEQKRIKELSKIYEKMTPAKAAITLASLDERLAADLLANMKVKSAARILDNLDKATAAKLSRTFTITTTE